MNPASGIGELGNMKPGGEKVEPAGEEASFKFADGVLTIDLPQPEAGKEAAEEEPPAEPTGPSAEDMAKAKEEFIKGKELFDAKDFENAVDQFKESYKLSKNPVLLYNIAFTHDEIGDQQMATFYYEKFLKDTDMSTGPNDPSFCSL